MRLDLFRSLWGFVGDGGRFPFERLDDALAEIARSPVEYTGIVAPSFMVGDPIAFGERLAAHRLEYIAQVITFGSTVDEHLASFRMQLEMARAIPHRLVVSLSGSDAFAPDEGSRFFDEALRIQADLGVRVAHETHRGRILFHPRIARGLLEDHQDLEVSCDFSHWCVVCERLIDDQQEVIELCADRALHIDARVGYENGPQVDDPSAPEWRPALAAHERWWDVVWERQKARGLTAVTLAPEFGPPTYQHASSGSKDPIGDRIAINDWMAIRQRERFRSRFG